MTLGAAGMAGFTALARPFTAGARKNQRKTKKKKGDVYKLCKEQAAVWTSYGTIACDGTPAQCQAALTCAAPLGVCDFRGFFDCLVAAVNA